MVIRLDSLNASDQFIKLKTFVSDTYKLTPQWPGTRGTIRAKVSFFPALFCPG